jgi:predicted ArsR family transcriptional regulator
MDSDVRTLGAPQADARGAVCDAAASQPGADGPAGTRARVIRLLLEQGPATAATLAFDLGLTPAAVRRHLDSLVAEGRAEARDRAPYGPVGRRGRGRPARIYALTEDAHAAFRQGYDDLAKDVLGYLNRVAGPEAVGAFARAHVGAAEGRYATALSIAAPGQRSVALAAALTADGYAASCDPAPAGGTQICQHHCPVAHVAAEFPQLCEAETEAFSRLLGTHVQRISTIAQGGHVCTTYVPPVRPVPSERTAS